MLEGKNYRITSKNILAHEVIGLRAEIIKSPDLNKAGIKGKVVDETKNLLILETKGGLKKIPKKEVLIKFWLGKETKEINGKFLVAKPEDRTKIYWRK